MERVNQVSRKQKMERINFLKVFLFVLFGVCLSNIRKDSSYLFLFVPYVSVCFYLGGSELFGCILGLLLGSSLTSFENLVISLLGLVSYFFVLIFTKLFPIKMKTRLIISSLIADLGVRILLNNLNIVLSIESIVLSISLTIITYMFLYYCTSLLSSKKFFHPYFLAFVGSVLCVFFQLIPSTNIVDLKNILILFTVIFISVIGGSGVGIISCVSMLIISYLFNGEFNMTLALLYLVSSLMSSVFNKTKPILLLVNLLSALFVVYLTNYDVSKYGFLIEFLSSYLLIMFVPKNIFNKLKRKFISHYEMFEFQEINYRRIHEKIGGKIGRISSSYQNIKDKLTIENNIDLEKRRLDIMFSNLCKICPKNHLCHVEKRNNNESIAKTILRQDLSYDERMYLENNCLKPSYFVNEGFLQRAYYESEIKHEIEYNKLKQTLLENLSGITSSLDSLRNEFENETGILVNGMEKNISLLLERINLEPIFVNYQDDHLNETIVEIGLKANEKFELEDLIKAKLEEYLHKTFKIVKVRTMPYENYIRITYSAIKNYCISFGVAQVSKDELYCGDSYASFTYNNEKYFVISDGMGYGKEAHLESESTIDSFRQIIETGVHPSLAIKTINSILKIRHKKDFFSTLDILKINEVDYIASITKTCAPSSYLFRDDAILEIDSYSLPIGIVEDVEAYDNVMNIKKNDIFIMSSDGFKLSKEEIKDFLIEYQDLPSQTLCEKLISFSKKETPQDDITLFVIKII